MCSFFFLEGGGMGREVGRVKEERERGRKF